MSIDTAQLAKTSSQNGFVSARLPLFKNRGSSRGAKEGNRVRQGVQKLAFVQRSACNSKQPMNPATETRRLTNSSSRRSDARLPSPRPPGRRRRPALWHPCVSMPPHTPCTLSSVFCASPRHALSARTPQPPRRHTPSRAHTPLARTMLFREMLTPSPPIRIAPFLRTQPSRLCRSPRDAPACDLHHCDAAALCFAALELFS